MRLKYLNTILEQQDGAARTATIDWSPNGQKLAVATADRAIILFDQNGEKRDKFATKPVDAKAGKKSYSVKCIAFSPDSTKLAVGQTDNIVFVYRLGESWEEKKVICNKFSQSAATTSLIWPNEDRLIVGLADGKVRIASCHNNKCSTIYRTDFFVVSLAIQPNNSLFVSGHSDGSVISYSFSKKTQMKILTHQYPPFAMVYTPNGIVVAGCDRRVSTYSDSGRTLQQFDYSNQQGEKEFTVASRDPGGYNIVIGSFDRIRLFTWNQKRGAFDEGKPIEIQYLYTISALAWSPDGSTIAVGTLCGGVITIDCCLKRSCLKGRFDTTFVSPSQVVIKDMNDNRKISIRSHKGLFIEDIKILGQERFVVAYTASSMILANIDTQKYSEFDWHGAGNEKFYFDSEDICLIINAGEVHVVEYGNNDVVGWIRTELISPHLLSVKIVNRPENDTNVKRIAYLLDPNTICVVDLVSSSQIIQIQHPVPIDWLELSESASKLLYRDKRFRLSLVDLGSERKTSLLNYCTYVQWVPKSDVIVAQSGDHLNVWYQAEDLDQVVTVPIKGDIDSVVRDDNRTEVIVQEGNAKMAYELDQTLIEFTSALEKFDFECAVDFLERRNDPSDAALWRQLATVALDKQKLLIAQRCYAALNDYPRVKMLADTIRIAYDAEKTTNEDGLNYYEVQVRLKLMRKDFKEAENIYLKENRLDEAITMYQKNHKWEEALNLAKAKNYPDFESLKAHYYRHLLETGQYGKAAEMTEKDGDHLSAIDFYLKSNTSGRAATIILENDDLIANEELVQKVAIALIRSEQFEKAGDLFESTKDFERSLECYRKGKNFLKAVQLARITFPERVVTLEEEWGDHLVEEKNHDAAINHFLESGKSSKALDAAVNAKQWGKAAQIADVIEDTSITKHYYQKIAEHHASVGDFERAEMLYIEAGQHQEAIAMYNKANRWEDSHRLAKEFLDEEEANAMYSKLAQSIENVGRLDDAEKLYLSVGQPNKAISMHKKAGNLEKMMALVEMYHSEHVLEIHKHLASDLEEKGDLKGAEEQYLLAGDWKSAISMYRTAEQWNDAYRIAKHEGCEAAQKQVAYLWAKSLGGDAAVKLLQKFNLLNESIDFACENGAFDFAFELCRLGANERLPFVHVKLAQKLEEEDELEKAERHYIEGNKSREAVFMYIHAKEWDNAERVARDHCKEALDDVFVGQARISIDKKDYSKAESYLLRANRPDIMLRCYKELNMWPEVLRIAKDYVPSTLKQLQEEYDEVQLKSGAKGIQSFLAQGQLWETQGEYMNAIQCYLKVKEPETTDIDKITDALMKAAHIAIKFLPDEDLTVIDHITDNLLSYKKYNEAAEVFFSCNRPGEAIKAFVIAKQWDKAKKVANESPPELMDYINEKYKESLKNEGRIEELIDLDTVSAIDLIIEKGQWEKALDTARQQNIPQLLDKYVTLYVSKLVTEDKYSKAIEIFEKFGASGKSDNFSLYEKLANRIFNEPYDSSTQAYNNFGHLRNMLLNLCENIAKNSHENEHYKKLFERYLEVAHYEALKVALTQFNTEDMEQIIEHICISLLRYCDIIRPDKLFYEAGIACRKHDKERLAFFLLNHYLDLCDAIDDQNPSVVDMSVFEGTDIPQEVTIPESKLYSEEEHEEVKEWILAISVEQNIDHLLPLDVDGNFEGSLLGADGTVRQPCIITGYPVTGNAKVFGNSEKAAIREIWEKVTTIQKIKPSDYMSDVLYFINQWTKTSN